MKPTNNFKQLLISKNISRTSGLAGVTVTPSNIADGETVVTDLTGRILSTATSGLTSIDQVVVVQGQGSTNPLRKSAPIAKAGLRTLKDKAYSAAVQQIDYIGYNGSTGSIDTTVTGNAIIVRSIFKTNFYQFSDKLMESIVGYKVTSNDTQGSVALALVKAINLDVKKYVNIPFKAEMVNSGANTTITGAPTSFTFTNGSAVVSYAGTDPSNIAAGDYLRVGTAVTDPVYKITAIDTTANTITLATAYYGSTATILLASVKAVLSADAVAGDFGVKITGLAQRLFSESKPIRYEVSKWDLSVQNGGTTDVTPKYVTAYEGTGTYEQVAEAEWFFNFSEGFADQNSIQIPPVTFVKNVSTTGTYKILSIEWAKQAGTFDILSNPVASLQLDIAADNDGGGTNYEGAATSVVDVLSAWSGITI